MKIEIDVSDKNEGTASPWWCIIDPDQNFKVNEQGIYKIASMITGPYFSRKEAEDFLKATSYNFSKHARVFCFSGCYSYKYDKAYREVEKMEKYSV